MSMFKSKPVEQQQQPQQGTVNPGNLPNAVNPSTDPANPTAPAKTPEQLAAEQASVSPLDQFKDLWETSSNKGEDDAPKPLNAQELQAAVSKADFSKAISPELLAQISAGGEEAARALPAILNAVAQQTMVQSTLVNNKLMEQAVAAAIAKQDISLASKLREQQAASHLKDSNPLFDNPAVKPVIEATRQQLLQKFPNATPAEITKMTNSYIVAMGEQFAPKPATVTNASDVDWEKFLSN